MDSNTIRIGLMHIILVWAVISAITDMARRSGNKGALRQLKQEGEPPRCLGAEEQALAQPGRIAATAAGCQPELRCVAGVDPAGGGAGGRWRQVGGISSASTRAG